MLKGCLGVRMWVESERVDGCGRVCAKFFARKVEGGFVLDEEKWWGEQPAARERWQRLLA